MTHPFRAAAAVALTVPFLATGCSALGIGAESLDAGDVVRAADLTPTGGTPAAQDGWTGEIQLPDGLFTVRVVPLDDDEVSADDTFADRAAKAGGDTTLVAVSWAEEAGAGVPQIARGLVLDAGGVDDEVALVSGDDRISLEVDGLSRTGGFAYAAVDDPDDLSLEVVFDGVAQSVTADAESPHVDEAAQPLYDAGADATSEFADCLDRVTPASLADEGSASCRVQSAAWPWVLGDGWSDGGPWRVVRLETTLSGATGDDVADTDVTATVDGSDPVSGSDAGSDETSTTAVLVFGPGGSGLEVDRTSTVGGKPATLTGSADLDQR